MLKSLTFANNQLNLKSAKEIHEGVYQADLNFKHTIDYSTDYRVISKSGYIIDDDDNERYVSWCGVCDDFRQVVLHVPELLVNSNHYVISLTSIKRDEQPYSGGWKWSKWGDYIGIHEPKEEYLAYEDEIDEVFVYHIYEVKRK